MSGGLDARSRAELARLAGAGTVLRRRLQGGLRKAGDDAKRRAQERIRGAASHRGGSLRAEIAATMTVATQLRRDGAGLTIRSLGARMPPGRENLAARADAGRWRHPVYGGPWVTQRWPSAQGWFSRTLRGQADAIAAELSRALDDAARELGR